MQTIAESAAYAQVGLVLEFPGKISHCRFQVHSVIEVAKSVQGMRAQLAIQV